jgi:hypothetical protein
MLRKWPDSYMSMWFKRVEPEVSEFRFAARGVKIGRQSYVEIAQDEFSANALYRARRRCATSTNIGPTV